jgi:hypothetical protein
MKWLLTNLFRAGFYAVLICSFLVAFVVLTSCAEPPDKENPAMKDVYATANVRIDQMQTSIAADLTAQAIKQATPPSDNPTP